ncbi:MAG: flagellar M-ring protein FliF [Rhodospirillales bacterium RIFCSPLOWO2_12_FULL_67_15]|nr:MAG: flagellar M-ring protein FliF [Rhodospirillales bacterium RIFCSPLOWO2_12_FULL_67_15]
MDTFLQAIRNIGAVRLVIMGGLVAGLVGFFIFMLTRFATPSFTPLYSNLDLKDSARIVQQLESQNIPFELKQGGTTITVPGDRVARARMTMASQGLPSGGSTGYELFDKADTLGATNFMQNVNLVRAMEGEMSRTIQTISGVRSARVHLVLPRRELFSRDPQKPSASVVLQMQGSRRLDTEQIGAIQHLVASAIPGLLPSRISIVDDKGSLLARGFEDESSPTAVAAKVEQRRRAFELQLGRTVEELLERTVGPSKVRAEVSAEMDYDRVTTQEERFDPDGQVVRSTQTISQTASSRDAQGEQAVTVAGALPDAGATGAEAQSSQTADNRSEETVNYEISKKIVNHVKEAGTVRRLSVAVLVDGIYDKTSGGAKPAYTPRAKEELEMMAALVRGAIGYNEARGDRVEMISMQFADLTPIETPIELFFGFNKQDIVRMAEVAVLSVVAIMVLLLVVRPLISRALEALPGAAAGIMRDAQQLAQQMQAPALTGPGGAPMPVEGEEEEQFEELIDIDRVEGRVKASSVKKVGEIVEKHPEEALSILRSWMYQEV